jgi:transposase-like protein
MDCEKDVKKTSQRCLECYQKANMLIKNRPSYEQLIIDIEKLNFTGTGEKYNVCDNTIRKWIRKYEKDVPEENKILKKNIRIPKPSYEELMNTIKDTNNAKQTATKYGVDTSTILEWRKKYEKDMSEEDKIITVIKKPSYEELINTFNTKSIKETAIIYDVGVTTIYKWKRNFEKDITEKILKIIICQQIVFT